MGGEGRDVEMGLLLLRTEVEAACEMTDTLLLCFYNYPQMLLLTRQQYNDCHDRCNFDSETRPINDKLEIVLGEDLRTNTAKGTKLQHKNNEQMTKLQYQHHINIKFMIQCQHCKNQQGF